MQVSALWRWRNRVSRQGVQPVQRPELGVFKDQTENHVVGTCEGVNDEGGQVRGGQLTWDLFKMVARVHLYSQKISESFRQGYDVPGLKFLENHLVSVWRSDRPCLGEKRNQGDQREEAVSPGWVRESGAWT